MLGFGSLSELPLSTLPIVAALPKIETLTDDFNDNSRDVTKWTEYVNNGSVSETNGQLQITPTGAGFGFSGYVGLSTNPYDLTGSMCTVNMVQPVNNVQGAEAGLRVGNTNDEIAIFRGGGALVCRYGINGVNNDDYPAWSDDFKFLRIREAAGTLYWETSLDNITYTIRRQVAVPINITGLQVGLFAGQYQAVANPGTAIFDNLNITSVSPTGQRKIFVGGAWVGKPVKIHNGTTWVTKPQKIHNGTTWVVTNN